jgi:hypothetical protein
MNANARYPGCACCPLSRRNFLARTGATAAGTIGTLAAPAWLAAATPATPVPRAKIRIIHSLHGERQEGPDWPNKGFDFRPVIERIGGELTRRCPGFEFVTSLATGEEQARKILEQDQAGGGIDGYLVYQMNCWNRVVQTIATSGKPVLYADFQFGGSGGFLVYNAKFLRDRAPNVGFVASSRIEDVAAAVMCFAAVKDGGTVADFVAATARARAKDLPPAGAPQVAPDELRCLAPGDCLARLKERKLLAVRDQTAGPEAPVAGLTVQRIPFAEVNEAWSAADRDESKAVADRWQQAAEKVEGVSRETLEASAAMYLGMKSLLQKHGAQGITINCLGGFYGKHIHAYPCLGFHQLNNEGLVGGCECDVRSAATMLIGTTLTQGRPGYISDPVIDTSKRQIIYAHCVAATKVFGPEGRSNPFQILTHSEDRQGASVRSLLPTGHLTTSLEFDQARKEILFHQAVAVGNDPDDRACRTKLCAEPLGDIEKLFTMWDAWGWHRVTFYGDLRLPVETISSLMGFSLVLEG